MRLDLEIDGPANAIYEVDTLVPDDNPTGSAFRTHDRLLGTELEAIRRADAVGDS